jgi:hypothetical protein
MSDSLITQIIPKEWIAQLPQPPEAPTRQAPAKPPQWMLDEHQRLALVAGMGILGGLAIGSWAFEHMFVEGLEDKERKSLIGFGALAVGAYGLVTLLDLDKRWLDVEGTAEKAQEFINTGKVTP